MIGVELRAQFRRTDSSRDGKRAQVVGAAAVDRSQKIGKSQKLAAPLAFPLLAQRVKPSQFVLPGVVGAITAWNAPLRVSCMAR